jgi:hypothetical protein
MHSHIFGDDGGWRPEFAVQNMVADCAIDAHPAAAVSLFSIRLNSFRNIIVPAAATTSVGHRLSVSVQRQSGLTAVSTISADWKR